MVERRCRFTSRYRRNSFPKEPAAKRERMLALSAGAHVELKQFADTLCRLI